MVGDGAAAAASCACVAVVVAYEVAAPWLHLRLAGGDGVVHDGAHTPPRPPGVAMCCLMEWLPWTWEGGWHCKAGGAAQVASESYLLAVVARARVVAARLPLFAGACRCLMLPVSCVLMLLVGAACWCWLVAGIGCAFTGCCRVSCHSPVGPAGRLREVRPRSAGVAVHGRSDAGARADRKGCSV